MCVSVQLSIRPEIRLANMHSSGRPGSKGEAGKATTTAGTALVDFHCSTNQGICQETIATYDSTALSIARYWSIGTFAPNVVRLVGERQGSVLILSIPTLDLRQSGFVRVLDESCKQVQHCDSQESTAGGF